MIILYNINTHDTSGLVHDMPLIITPYSSLGSIEIELTV